MTLNIKVPSNQDVTLRSGVYIYTDVTEELVVSIFGVEVLKMEKVSSDTVVPIYQNDGVTFQMTVILRSHIEIDLREIVSEDVKWIEVAHVRAQK
jgi:hypothetical protein